MILRKWRVVRDFPFMIGHIGHFLPPEMWTDEMKASLRFMVCVEERDWLFWWKFRTRLTLTLDEYNWLVDHVDEWEALKHREDPYW